MNFKKYLHVERLENDDIKPILQNSVVNVTAKVDGTNAVIWYDGQEVCGGSRTRQLSAFSDNAGFYSWLQSNEDEAIKLRQFVIENPQYVVYAEWLGFDKFVGQIKTYNSFAKGHCYIFDVLDIDAGYLPDQVWRPMLAKYGLELYFVELLAVLDHPSYEDVVEIAKSNKFLLDNDERPGEGVVCKAPTYRNKWGQQVYGKIVLDEFKERKGKKKNKDPQNREGLENNIVDYWVTDSELAKAREKVCVILNVDKFDIKNGKHIGIYLELIWADLLEEMKNICKQYKNPIIDFRLLRNACNTKGRKYIGLI